MMPSGTAGFRKMRVSVIIPVYNGELYVAEAIDSVLNQSLRAWEIIVVDDGSTDSSAEILDSYGDRIIVLKQPNGGTASARNAGIEKSRGDVIAFLDQDDYWTEDKLERQVKLLENDSSAEIIWGDVKQFISPELDTAFKARIRCPERASVGYLPSAALIRRAAFEKVGLFDSKWKIGEWADWYARSKSAELASRSVEAVVCKRRIHKGNKGLLMSKDRGEYARLIGENLKRKRKQRI